MVAVDVLASEETTFDYSYLPISDLDVETTTDKKTGRTKVSNILVQGEPIPATDRFWTSLFARYGFNSSFFKYFDHAEVFSRISDRESNDRMRLTIERSKSGNKLLAVSNPTKPLVSFGELRDMLGQYSSENVTYSNGVVESIHSPRSGTGDFNIGGDAFQNRFVLSTPIDGYGMPNVYLSLLRLICANGAVGYSRVFRSQLALGKGADDVTHSIGRVLDGFGNDEGYAAMRQRFEASQHSWASIYEAQQLHKLLFKLYSSKEIDRLGSNDLSSSTSIHNWFENGKDVHFRAEDVENSAKSPLFRAFESMTGNAMRLYGLANMDALSMKRQRTLPVRCTVYDCINFATEVATHYAEPAAARRLQAWVGETISNEYDMEGTKEKFTDFTDLYLPGKLSSGLTGSEHEGELD